MDWENAYFVKLYRSTSPDWLALPVLTRGLFAELMLLADRAGRIQLGRAGVASVAIPLRATDATIGDVMQHVQQLLDDGCIYVDCNALVIRNFADAQRRALTSTERSQKLREEGKAPGKPAKAKGKRPVQRDATDATDATIGGTEATQCNGRNDKEQTDQNKQIRTEEAEKQMRASAPAKLDDPNAQKILDALLACPSLARLAHRGTAEALVAHVNGGAKKLEWVVAAVREFGEQESILAGSPSGPTPDRELAAGLRGFVAKARAATTTGSAGGGGYPSRPHLAEAPSVASQKPFHYAPRGVS